ncbi:unnamed protein product [Onchocerca flexuosa]|uniref:KTSC domain-containing protein n=1 Tax=Onchocerca flexuosa TaxID=387005 RepID=A0A183HHD5_9BILA|nr:unnamed protein product [Onchocerca flexuosa]
MYALGVGNNLLVPYASCAIMEIYKKANNHTTVKFFYKNGTTVYQLALPGCPSFDNCTITQVRKAVSGRTVRSLQQLKEVYLPSSPIAVRTNYGIMMNPNNSFAMIPSIGKFYAWF